MARRVVAADAAAYEPAEVDLWASDGGGMFETVEMVKDNAVRFDDLSARAADADTTDKTVAILAEMYDILLRPVGHRRKASKIVVDRFDANRLSIPRIEDLIEEIAVAARPT